MTRRIALLATLVVLAYGCATTAPPPVKVPDTVRGVASWYGEEFSGRTTANGEIFDPTLLTAAHRTLPFGTIVEVTNPKNRRFVWVRVNDRGPYIANRMIDLSYAAAERIGLVRDGVGDVDIKVIKLGSESEAPAPFDVTIAEAPAAAAPIVPAPPPSEPPAVAFPIPVKEEPVVVDRVTVETQRGEEVTRKQVADDGRTIKEVPTGERRQPEAGGTAGQRPAPRATTGKKQFVVQVGAFAVEANAKLLQERLSSMGQRAWVDKTTLYRVRIGPFATRELAAQARESLEANGLSAIILSE